MRSYGYPVRSLVGDYCRSAMGLAVGLTALAALPSSWVIGLLFGTLTLLFLLFGLRTAYRHHLIITVNEQEIRCRNANLGIWSGGKALPWGQLSSLKLRYFGSRRRSSRSAKGFFQLTLKGSGVSMMFDSHLQNFDTLVRQALHAARRNDVSLDSTTASNLISLGIDVTQDLSEDDPLSESWRTAQSFDTTMMGSRAP